ncbi:hypothetical protein DC3_57540 [Deinococcus cellulosilyticus NBRC 106333 = KACC 11606]|uniref:Uncharacterized protein n=1 Tax=Deinococcus cellulosilyticus (strain DSM 18568 / NBRC 106333 / KACC 11606 / 5516J-15) TaxID=1223518 RepID=A0A511NBB9_DEIC1|nr:hypothetical protein DC3_57540 [Deinococcus cellulosilyticus NBRC 106333 = KACC 11606]
MRCQKLKPLLSNKFTICKEPSDSEIVQEGQQAFQQLDAVLLAAIARMIQNRPAQCKSKGVPNYTDQQHVDVVLSQLPVCAVNNKVNLAGVQVAKDQTSHQKVREVTLNKAFETFVATVWGARQLQMGHQLIEYDRSGLDHAQNQGGENMEFAGIQGEIGPEEVKQRLMTRMQHKNSVSDACSVTPSHFVP